MVKTKMWQIMLALLSISMMACSSGDEKTDASGNFEATEITVSAEANGKLLFLHIEEGAVLSADSLVGLIDTTELFLKQKQLMSQKNIIAAKNENILAQIEVQRQQKQNLLTEKSRLEKLLADGAATGKQMDDIRGNISLIEKQIASVETQTSSVAREIEAIEVQMEQLAEAIRKCYIVNPIAGTVLTRFAEAGEITGFSKPLYKMAELSEIFLKVFVSGNQLANLKLGQSCTVLVDDGTKGLREMQGVISWIASVAEFTPKTIQTREERVSLVYAVKIRVKNDGTLKIGMPGEVRFSE